MNWGAHKADVRIAAKNSVTMRAALRASINASAIYEAYQDTHPVATDNITQDRARARAWAMLHVKINPEPIKAALAKIYADGFLLGLDASTEAVNQARKDYNKAAITKAKKKEEEPDYVDWDNWKPGNRAAALLYRPTGAFEKILNDAGIVSKKIAANGFDRIGTALADAVAAGFSPARTAKVITEKIGDPARALTIAITEQNRAMSLASMENYERYGLEKVEWSGANPCDICAPNEGQVVNLGEEFKSGDTEPPVHPNCRCAVLPVIDEDLFAEPNTTGVDDFLNIGAEFEAEAAEEYTIASSEDERDRLSAYQWADDKFMQLARGNTDARDMSSLSDEFRALSNYKGSGYVPINNYLRQGKEWKELVNAGLMDAEKIEDLKKVTSLIDRAMAAAPGLPENLITFRSVTGQQMDELLGSLQPGDVYAERSYSSTTMDEKFAKDWGGSGNRDSWKITIENPAGTQGIMLDGLRSKHHGFESEWLLPRDTEFEVLENNPHTREITVRVKQK